jgi:hypothetical protein
LTVEEKLAALNKASSIKYRPPGDEVWREKCQPRDRLSRRLRGRGTVTQTASQTTSRNRGAHQRSANLDDSVSSERVSGRKTGNLQGTAILRRRI